MNAQPKSRIRSIDHLVTYRPRAYFKRRLIASNFIDGVRTYNYSLVYDFTFEIYWWRAE